MTGDRIAEEVARITDEARRIDAEEDARFGDARGDELPAELADPASRKARLAEAFEVIKAEDSANEERSKSRKRTKPAKANVTDPQCPVMKGPHNYFPAYNAQAAAATDGTIVAVGLTDEAVDNHQFVPLVDEVCANADEVGLDRPHTALADTGYFTNDNINYRTGDDPAPLSLPAVPSPRRRPPPRSWNAASRPKPAKPSTPPGAPPSKRSSATSRPGGASTGSAGADSTPPAMNGNLPPPPTTC